MALEPGTRLGPYEILSQIGAGGMGEVYKGRDTRLDRLVALKLLAPHLAANREARERFEREATTVAKLKHAHICLLYDIGKDAGRDYLVFEYLEGETLSQRLAKGPLPLDLVLQYAIEIADALDKAHRAGVTHRDIKPGNIMVVPSSEKPSKTETKLLDFGLAKLKQAALPADLADLPRYEWPTGAGAPTAQGTVLGTAQYMAPEQVEGKVDELDARTDIFSFGATVYEMATGKKAFQGQSQASIMAAILKEDPPPVSSLDPPGKLSSPALDRVVKKCLAKEPEGRWQSASDLRDELKWIAAGGGQAAAAEAKPVAKPWRRAVPLSWASLMAAIVAVLASVVVWYLRPSSPPLVVSRFAIPLPAGVGPGGRTVPYIALSPHGTHLAYVASNQLLNQLYVRAMDAVEFTRIADTEDTASPFFSPDGQWIGFFAGGKLKKVSVAGGAPLELCDAGGLARGAAWGTNETIVFSSAEDNSLSIVASSGGVPEKLTTLKEGEISHNWPEFLPDGKTILFTVGIGENFDDAHIAVQRLDDKEHRILIRGGTYARYASTGHLIFYRAGTLIAVAFDADRLEVTGTPVPVLEDVRGFSPTGAAQFSLSRAGSLVYFQARGQAGEQSTLVWVDRTGAEQPLAAPPQPYNYPRFSPDARRVLLEVEPPNGHNVWVYELARSTLTRLTFGSGGHHPIWTPDGNRATFQSGAANMFWKPADGSGTEEQLTTSENRHSPQSWSSDGKTLVFVESHPTTREDVWVLPLEGDPLSREAGSGQGRKPRPFLQTRFREPTAALSPDGRWLAYVSDESGRFEVYVQPFPGPGGKWQISNEGGTEAVWARSGRELFYRNGDKMMAVEIATNPSFVAGTPKLLFEEEYASSLNRVQYDVSPDGQRFLMVKPTAQAAAPTQINVVLNWFEELKKRVPSGP